MDEAKQDIPPIELAGLKLVYPKHTSFRQDARVAAEAANCGLAELASIARDADDLTRAGGSMLGRVYGSGRIPQLLGALLVEEGKTWSEDGARLIADRIAGISEPAEKDLVFAVVNQVILHFFREGAASSGLSLSSLRDDAAPAPSRTSEAPKSDVEPSDPTSRPTGSS